MDYDIKREDVEIPNTLPLLPVRDVVIFSYMILPLFVGREGSIKAVDEALSKDRLIFLATQKDPTVEDPKPEGIYSVGTVATVMRMLKLPDGRVKILVQGLMRGRIIEYTQQKPCYIVNIEKIKEPIMPELPLEAEALMRSVKEHSEKVLSLRGLLSSDVLMVLNDIEDPGRLADLVGSNLNLKIEEAQQVLEIFNPIDRLIKVNELLSKEVELSSMQAKIQSQAKEEMTKTQRDYFLREQLRAIKNELGDADERTKETIDLKKKIKKAKMPKEVEKEANKQLDRLEQMHPDAAEASIVRTYLDWLVELPWKVNTKDNLDIKAAKKVLDEDHYNLEKVKERILEYLGVRKLSKKKKGPILCFVGPPGVGKTSLGKSIARALGRKFTRISLGGVRDEAEIRGHRRTYVGALPGRIIQSIKQAGSNNPVFVMDEIDKVGADFRGDPSAALLEVLDPEQNSAFSDHYLNVPFDLSNVMFITTANLVDPIIPALKDRMEVITLSGYTEEEKLKIALKFLLPRQLEENGITEKDMKISNEAILQMISHYTHEAGLRNLEREIAGVCRKVARRIAEGKKGGSKVNRGNLHKYLGTPRYLPEEEQSISEAGVATGLAWTQAGGEILHIEASTMKGKGNLILTGQLGDVMKESAQAAMSYARSKAKELNLDEDFYKNQDAHIHIPAGAIPKDGPSAGITMATALISALSKTPVDKDIAMTGEITLRGRVLPIGGLKEKALAALRAKIGTVIIPERNKKDLDDIPNYIKKKINFVFAKKMDEVLKAALLKGSRVENKRGGRIRADRENKN
ncbi:MAG: endopeptidase La [Deltaproteobacteria bacterium CG_4_9_14_3_um_filter_44_9]|nr:MAG: endopeptidase La [Deltaproteobacteria bacterium CG06_land_8_20_14_3_00_44_19]PIX24533.1 MAG: endopeptidase La [Deltaproteobacteria bacterium CG_4_8_14_3_um_filter_43_13]PJB46686.1 MAG: endopeptidase La [Deltaproteobacteria bacterium CG_4_9_14_3_um_filter_44_9]HCX89367.1 endopeptidase La [Deltaproteobacteria bacterium]